MFHSNKSLQFELGLRIAEYLRKFSSVPGATEAVAEGESEKTSTRRFPALGAADPVIGALRKPRRSADGDGVDCENKAHGETGFIKLLTFYWIPVLREI